MRTSRGLLPLIVTVLAVGAGAPGATAAGPLFNGNCINEAPDVAPVPVGLPGDEVEVLAQAGAVTEAAGRVVSERIGSAGILARVKAEFERGGARLTVPPTAGGGPRFRVYVVDRFPGAVGGLAAACSRRDRFAMVLPASTASEADLRTTVAHEFAHMFQDVVAGGYMEVGWWGEATAEWVGQLLEPQDVGIRDDTLFPRPFIALDSRAEDHEYAVWRFVQFLAGRTSRAAFWVRLHRTFRAIGSGGGPDETDSTRRGNSRQTRIVDAEMLRGSEDIGDLLGRFWATHMVDTPDNGPAARVDRVEVRAGDQRLRLRSPSLGALLIRPTPRTGLRRIKIRIPEPGRDDHVWTGPRPLVERKNEFVRTYCLAGADSTAVHPQLPAGYTIAHTNGGRDRADFSVYVTGYTDRTGCSRKQPTGGGGGGGAPVNAPCVAEEGTYDTPGSTGPVRVKLSLDCFRGTLTIQGITGEVPCGSGPDPYLPLGPGRDTYFLLKQEARNGSLETTYMATSTTRVRLSVTFAGSTASGSVQATGLNAATGEPTCTSATQTFTARLP